MKKIIYVIVLVYILAFCSNNALAMSLGVIKPTPVPQKTQACNNSVCDTKYGCILNRCSTTITLTCDKCGYVAGGVNDYCGKCGKSIVILPGYGASWNADAMLLNKKVKDSEWKLLGFAKSNYMPLVDGITKSVGATKNKVYFWPYDWRRPIKDISASLDLFINEKVLKGEKIVIVGHSLGGLVGRVWSQDHSSDLRLEKVITIGSPQLGSLSAYEAWGFGRVGSGGSDLGSIGLNVLIELNRKAGQAKSDAVRGFVPMVKDLLPLYDYAKIFGKLQSYKNMETVNTFMEGKNKTISSISGKLVSIVGIGSSTKEGIEIGDIKISNYWHKGGDGTVIENSAGAFGTIKKITGSHAGLPVKALSIVLEELGINNIKTSSVAEVPLAEQVVIFGDPINRYSLECATGGKYESDEFGFIVLDLGIVKNCNIVVKSKVKGDWTYVVGKTDEPISWKKDSAKVELNKTTNIKVDEKLLEKVLGDTDNPWKIKILPMPTATPTPTPKPTPTTGSKMKILPMPTATPTPTPRGKMKLF